MKMLSEEGGPAGHLDPETVSNCVKHCKKCISLGFPFIQVDAMHGGMKFMHFEVSHRELFGKRWQLHEEQKSQPPAIAGGPQRPALGDGTCSGTSDADRAAQVAAEQAAAAAAADQAAAEQAAAAAEQAAKAAAERAAKEAAERAASGGPPPPGGRKSKEKTPGQAACADVKKWVLAVQTCVAQAKSLCVTIDTEFEWAWAKTDAVYGALVAQSDSLQVMATKTSLGAMCASGMRHAQVLRAGNTYHIHLA